jgi:hypothetical protein
MNNLMINTDTQAENRYKKLRPGTAQAKVPPQRPESREIPQASFINKVAN